MRASLPREDVEQLERAREGVIEQLAVIEELEAIDRAAAASRGVDHERQMEARRGDLLNRLAPPPPPRAPRRTRTRRPLSAQEEAGQRIWDAWHAIQDGSGALAEASEDLSQEAEDAVATLRRRRDAHIAQLESLRPELERAGIPSAIDAYRELADFLLFCATTVGGVGVGLGRFVLDFIPGALQLLELLYDALRWGLLSGLELSSPVTGALSPTHQRLRRESEEQLERALRGMIEGITHIFSEIEAEDDFLQRGRLIGEAFGQILPMLLTLRPHAGGGAASSATRAAPSTVRIARTSAGQATAAMAPSWSWAAIDEMLGYLPPVQPAAGAAAMTMMQQAAEPAASQSARGVGDRGTGGSRTGGERSGGSGDGAPPRGSRGPGRSAEAALAAAETEAQFAQRAQRDMARISRERARRLAQVERSHRRLAAGAERARARWRQRLSGAEAPRGGRSLGELVLDIRSLAPGEATRHLRQLVEPNLRRLGEINEELARIWALERRARTRGRPELLDEHLDTLQAEGRITRSERRASSSRSRDTLLAERDAIQAENTLLDAELRWHEWNLDPNYGILRYEYAARYGVRPYAELRGSIRGTEAHHLIEQRFAEAMGQDPSRMAAILLTPGEHQFFTNQWARRFPQRQYPRGTLDVTRPQLEAAAREIYADLPQVLDALGLR